MTPHQKYKNGSHKCPNAHPEKIRELRQLVWLDREGELVHVCIRPGLPVVQHDLLGLVLLVDRLGDHLVDAAVVVDVLVVGLAVLEDVVIVPVVDDEDSAGPQEVVELLEGCLLVPEGGGLALPQTSWQLI